MKETVEKIFDLLKKAALLLIVVDNKIDEKNTQLPTLTTLIEDVERELNQALADVRKMDESEPKAQLLLKVLLEQQLPEKEKRLSDLEQQLRTIE